MKTITIKCLADGGISINDGVKILSNENEVVNIIIDFSGLGLETYTKRADILVSSDGTIDFIVGDTSNQLSFNLGAEHLKHGMIKIQPIAYIDADGQEYVDAVKQKWTPFNKDVEYSLNVSESTTNVSTPLGEQLQAEIDQLESDVADLQTLGDGKININGDNSNIDVLSFKTSTLIALSQIGQLRWNDTDKNLEVKLSNDVTMSIGKETLLRATNKELSTILNGKAAYVSGGAGTNVWCKLATTTDQDIAQATIGVATEDLLTNENGYICTEGIVNGIDTHLWAEGTVLYLGTNGDLTSTAPVAPTPKVFIGIVLRSQSQNGAIYVKVRPVPRLSKLSDVNIVSPVGSDVIAYNDDTLRYENSSQFANFKITKEGGYAIKLLNNTGSSSVKGTLVSASPNIDNSFILQTNEFDTIGVVYEDGIANESSCWVVISGIAQVLLKNSTSATRGYWAIAADTDGRANITQPTPQPNNTLSEHTIHFKEIGHCIESKNAGTDVLAKCVLHFN